MVPLLSFTLAWFRLYERQILRLWFRECWLSSLANVYIYSILTEKCSTLSNDAREGRKKRLKNKKQLLRTRPNTCTIHLMKPIAFLASKGP